MTTTFHNFFLSHRMLENAGLQYCTQLPSQDTSVKFNFTSVVSLENKFFPMKLVK